MTQDPMLTGTKLVDATMRAFDLPAQPNPHSERTAVDFGQVFNAIRDRQLREQKAERFWAKVAVAIMVVAYLAVTVDELRHTIVMNTESVHAQRIDREASR